MQREQHPRARQARHSSAANVAWRVDNAEQTLSAQVLAPGGHQSQSEARQADVTARSNFGWRLEMLS